MQEDLRLERADVDGCAESAQRLVEHGEVECWPSFEPSFPPCVDGRITATKRAHSDNNAIEPGVGASA